MYAEQGAMLQRQGKFREAEKLFVSIDQPDAAISMYKQQKQYDQVCYIVHIFKPKSVAPVFDGEIVW